MDWTILSIVSCGKPKGHTCSFRCFDLVAMESSRKQWFTGDHIFFALVSKNAPKVRASTVPFVYFAFAFP